MELRTKVGWEKRLLLLPPGPSRELTIRKKLKKRAKFQVYFLYQLSLFTSARVPPQPQASKSPETRCRKGRGEEGATKDRYDAFQPSLLKLPSLPFLRPLFPFFFD